MSLGKASPVAATLATGWVEESDGPARVVDERRRHYRLTKSGREAITNEVERLDELMRLARAHRIVPRSSRS
jgi:DNA-binding MarR family transcriptional regulator